MGLACGLISAPRALAGILLECLTRVSGEAIWLEIEVQGERPDQENPLRPCAGGQ